MQFAFHKSQPFEIPYHEYKDDIIDLEDSNLYHEFNNFVFSTKNLSMHSDFFYSKSLNYLPSKHSHWISFTQLNSN